jgi:hypothetical protein
VGGPPASAASFGAAAWKGIEDCAAIPGSAKVSRPPNSGRASRRKEKAGAGRSFASGAVEGAGTPDSTEEGLAARSSGSDGARVSQEERRFLPHLRQQFIQVVWRRGTRSGLQVLLRRDVVQKTVVGIVEEFALLPLFHVLDDQAKLFSDLVVGFATLFKMTYTLSTLFSR